MKKKGIYAILLTLMCTALAFTSRGKELQDSNASNLWVGIGYIADGDKNQSAVIGAVGATSSTMWGAVAGMAFGGPAGAAVGLAVGL